ncbi:Fur family zinc uptake transcriptional regulator [Pullulanibacillus pueri]|uniref:Zinc-specific metallo-regulatory protein n=1 Tax=Pullulanibacillus pueri TaxID=1437324 RepID=A0A8J2ZUC7_9BACL|nr:Fur family transcriptional regulator [Pullulanibacillus pueri]MBM7681175.1 Fur family zinc uptake transcriptional regulator [Pullulanibacillus pueri]GGH77341.1 zinc-specific metallo-regulatory protein [Pullulanibacillus pueri]
MNAGEALRLLKQEGYKQTDKREDILEIFSDSSGYLSARDVLTQLQSSYDRLSFDTIYRNLSLFVQLGILEETELDGEKHYQMRCEGEHHHHLICKKCGKTEMVDLCPMEILGSSKHFVITGHKFEIYGYCQNCQ